MDISGVEYAYSPEDQTFGKQQIRCCKQQTFRNLQLKLGLPVPGVRIRSQRLNNVIRLLSAVCSQRSLFVIETRRRAFYFRGW